MARLPVLAAAIPLFAVCSLSGCSSIRTVTTSGVLSAGTAAAGGRAGESVTGETVTKEVPHSSETVPEIRERGGKESPPPRGDVAMPPHRIRAADNAAPTSPPAGCPAGTGE